jgi:ubiquitin-protein ligase
MNIKGLFNAKKKADSHSPQDKETRIQRLLYDYSRVFKLFQSHPYITIKETFGTPPEKYVIIYRIDGLMQTGKSIEAQNEHTVEIAFPDRYPNEPPKARMATSLFHPNVSQTMIDLKEIWTQETDFADCLVRIGELISFKRYSTDEPLNSEAAQWALRNKSLLPLSDIDLGYAEIEEKSNAFLETKAEIQNTFVEKEEDEEQTKAIDIENDTPSTAAENISTSDTVAIVQEEGSTPSPEAVEQRCIEAAADKPKKQEETKSPVIETDRRKDAMNNQRVDKITENEPEKEKILNKPISAQISLNNDSTEQDPEILQEIGIDASAQKPSEHRKTRVYKIENNRGTVSMDSHEKESNPNMYALSRVPTGGPFCPQCGCHVEEYANFCGRCGTKLKVKSSQRVARIFFILGMIAIPILVFEGGSVIFLLNKKLSTHAPAAQAIEPAIRQPAAIQTPVENDSRQIAAQEPSPVTQKPVVSVSKNEPPVALQETRKPVSVKTEPPRTVHAPAEAPKPAVATVTTPKQAPVTVETQRPAVATAPTPRPAPVYAEAPRTAVAPVATPRQAPVAAEAPRTAVAPVATPRQAPVAAEAPRTAVAPVETQRPAPAIAESPKPTPVAAIQAPAPAAAAPLTESAKKKAAIDGYLSQPEGTQQQVANVKATPANQTTVNDNLKLARLYMGIGSYDDAITRFREVVKVDPYNQEAIQGLMQAKKMKASTSGK